MRSEGRVVKTATARISLAAEGNVVTNLSLISWTGKSFESEVFKIAQSSFVPQFPLASRRAKENL